MGDASWWAYVAVDTNVWDDDAAADVLLSLMVLSCNKVYVLLSSSLWWWLAVFYNRDNMFWVCSGHNVDHDDYDYGDDCCCYYCCDTDDVHSAVAVNMDKDSNWDSYELCSMFLLALGLW